MYKYEIETQNVDEQIRKLTNFEQIAEKHYRLAMLKSVNTVASAVKRHTPVYRGELHNNIGSTISTTGSMIVGKVGSSLKDEEYPKVMEAGRHPGGALPNIDNLARWVHLQMGIPNERAKRVAFAVAKSIQKKGIEGRRMFQKGFFESRAYVEQMFEEANEKIASELAVK